MITRFRALKLANFRYFALIQIRFLEEYLKKYYPILEARYHCLPVFIRDVF